jgi:DNA polymerase-4
MFKDPFQAAGRTIVHFDLDTFFVSAERLINSSLKNKPVVIGGMGDRGVVSSCSYEARNFGVHSAMPIKTAKLLCPEAVYIRGDMELYSRLSKNVTDIVAEKAPVYEKASIDEHYLDITGMDRFFGCYKWTHELRETIIKQTGLPISFGLSINKTVAKIATGEAKPNGEKEVPQPNVKPFLSPLSIRKIPMIGEKTFQTLRSMGITTIELLSDIPPEMMERLMGKNGLMLWKKANGIDLTPVIPYSEQKSMSHETTFEQDSTNVNRMKDIISHMAEKLAFQLRKEEKLTSCITVKIRYSNFDTHTLQKQISYTSLDHQLIATSLELFDRLYQRRMLIRLIGLRFSHLVNGVQQLDLFEDTPELINLCQAMDKIRLRYGPKAIRRAICFHSGNE